MKRFLITTSALLLAASSASAGTLDGSAHDFAAETWADGEMCNVCHAPHNNGAESRTGLLWNHTESAVTNYTVYDNSATMSQTPGQPSGNSKLCMSCHDGTVALDSYGATPTNTTTISGTANFGTSLTNDHPISISYSTAVTAGDELKTTASPVVWADGSGSGTVLDLLQGGDSVECSSCHDVHNTKTSGLADNKLLLVLNTNSALCLTCHTK